MNLFDLEAFLPLILPFLYYEGLTGGGGLAEAKKFEEEKRKMQFLSFHPLI